MALPLTKICSKCKKEKLLAAFTKHTTGKGGLHSHCKECQHKSQKLYRNSKRGKLAHNRGNKKYRESERGKLYHLGYRYLWEYGITLARYNEMLAKQNGLCAICGKPETETMRGKLKPLSVDHDHKTGKIRGLLCNNCNRAVGLLKEDIRTVSSMLTYLRDFR